MGDDCIKILLVDDDEISREAVHRALKKGGLNCQVQEAETLQQGRKLLETNAFDFALVDYRLPDGNGDCFIEEIRQREKGVIPAILLTAQGSEQIAVETMKKGALDYIPKGHITPELLCQSIRNGIRIYQGERALAERTAQLVLANKQLEEANIKLEGLTRIDPLTEVLNRRGFQEVLTRECQYASREGQYFIVLLTDLDNFKQINDTRGHDAGDIVLKEVAKRLLSKLRATDYVARIGGDEFMILLPKTSSAEGVEVAQKIRMAIAQPILWGPQGEIAITASIGMVMVEHAIRSIDELLAKTHLALARSKRSGKNRVAFDNEEEEKRWEKEKSSAQHLDLLRQKGGLHVVSQPIFQIDPMRIVGYEFFSRSHVVGFEAPDEFFRLAAEANMLSYIDCLCLENCVQSSLSLDPKLNYYLNLFPSTLLSTPVETFVKMLPAGRPAVNYCIEISERQFVGNVSDFAKTVSAIRQEGVRMVIDDVGFGHTFLESLILLSPDAVKIDRVCTSHIADDHAKRRSLERLLKVIRTLGCDIMAKGLESSDDLAVLRDLGVQFGQGFLLKSPNEDPSLPLAPPLNVREG